jgi:hypothetical protein
MCVICAEFLSQNTSRKNKGKELSMLDTKDLSTFTEQFLFLFVIFNNEMSSPPCCQN